MVKIMNKEELLKGGLDEVYRKSYYDLKARIDKAIEVLTDYEEDFVSIYETSWFVNKNDDEKTYSCGEYQKLLLEILRGEDNE